MLTLVKYISLLVFLIFFGCGKEKDIVDFPESRSLEGQPVQEIGILTGKGNISLAVVDTFLVVQKAEEPFIQIYSTNTHKRLVEFGREGKGPGEFMEPSLIKQPSYDKDRNAPVIHLFDFERQMTTTLNILEVLENEEITEQEKIEADQLLTFFHYINENFYVGTPYHSGRLVIHDYETSRDTVIPYVPKPDFAIPDQRLSQVYRSAVVVNTEKDLIAAAPILLGELDFFDMEGNYLRSTTFESGYDYSEKYSANLDLFSTLKFQIANMDTKNGLIYGLNINSEMAHFSEKEGNFNMKVQVFNWDGRPHKEYVLDNRLITSFAVDEIHNRIYAFSPLEPEHSIISYNIQS